jgi:hypothetical protein
MLRRAPKLLIRCVDEVLSTATVPASSPAGCRAAVLPAACFPPLGIGGTKRVSYYLSWTATRSP